MTMCVYLISSLTTLHKPKVLCKADYYANQLSLLRDLVDIEEYVFTQAEHLEGNSLSDCSLSDLEMLKFLMGLDDSYMQIRSSILSREVLHDVRSAYATISSEESQEVASGSIVGSSQRNQPSIFVSNVPNVNKFQRSNQNINNGLRPNKLNNNRQEKIVSNNNVVGSGSSSGFIDKQMATLISLIKDNKVGKNVQANMASTYMNNSNVFNENFNTFFRSNTNIQSKVIVNRKIVDSGASQHMTNTDRELDHVYNISHLKIKAGHPNGIKAFISKIRNLKLPNGLVQFDVMILFFKSGFKSKKGYGDWLGHPADPVLNVLKIDLQIENNSQTDFCETCQRAKLPYSVLIRKSPYDIIYKKPPTLSHLRVFGCLCFATVVNNHAKFGNSASKEKELDTSNVFQDLNHINFFNNEYPEMPYDDERVDPNLNSDQRSQSDSSHSSVPGRDMNTVDFSDDTFGNDAQNTNDIFAAQDEQVTTLEENISFGGNLDQNPNVSAQGTQNLRRSSRQSVFPKNYNGFVMDSKVNYGLERYVGYLKLNSKNYCFVTQLNKNCEPKTLFETSKFSHWTNVMNSEMDALLRNDTWDIVDLPKDRKPSSWPVFQLDVNNAFLYGDLIKTVYMKLPEEYFPSDNKDHSRCRLKKFLYGLKQAPRQWNAKLTYASIENGLGKLKYFLSIEIIDTDKGICLNQRKYVLDLLSEYDMLACKPTKTPLMSKLSISNKATDNDPTLDNITDYQKLMGKLIYLTNTRPDISYDVHCLGIHIIKNSGMNLKAFSDADWAKCVVSRKLVIGYCVFLNNSLVSWKSTKQNTLSKSLMETEYRALASVTSEVIWILKTLKDLKIDDRLPVFLHCDINSAIKIAANLVFMKEQKTWKLIYTL
ncbi:ribonuclease H-like domain-containing protein [Tanacetum coccineum]|uniref:Ribonuclease H-like domain-containing protein n=1 Tax=Tanacetum coccineum TaxID=301880 RepID=A0ABQ5G5V0_9ASTR